MNMNQQQVYKLFNSTYMKYNSHNIFKLLNFYFINTMVKLTKVKELDLKPSLQEYNLSEK